MQLFEIFKYLSRLHWRP